MKKILKYSLMDAALIFGPKKIDMPDGATILTVQMQRGVPMLWALVDEARPIITRSFVVLGTGWDIENADELTYVATYQQGTGVWHLFEVGAP